jgi:hypothetical protein
MDNLIDDGGIFKKDSPKPPPNLGVYFFFLEGRTPFFWKNVFSRV